MKYSDYFLSPATRWIATCAGLLSGSLTWMFTRWEYGMIGGVTVAVLVTLILPFVMYLQNLPIERLKAKIKGPFLFDEQVLFRSPKGAFGGYFILTDGSMVLMTRGREKTCMELTREDVRSVRLDDDNTLRVFLNETQYICILCGVAEEIFESLASQGWHTAKD